jgi:transposase
MSDFKVILKANEREKLKSIVSKGREKARKITRCRVLLLCDERRRKKMIALLLSINPNTISTICRRYNEEGVESAIHEKPRPGAPRLFDGEARAKITALACSTPPEGYSRWSLRLLSDKAVELNLVDSISHTDVGRILKKTKLSPI